MIKLINGEEIKFTKKEIEAEELNKKLFIESNEYIQLQIEELKKKLADTDYISAKIAEGSATREEYADQIKERQIWREEINQIQSKLNN